MSDPLDAAVRALRARSPMDDRDIDANAETRARLLKSVAHRARMERAQLAAAFTLIVLATNSTTWAWSTGRLPRAIDSLAAMLRPEAPAHERGEALGADEAQLITAEAEVPPLPSPSDDRSLRLSPEPAPEPISPQPYQSSAPSIAQRQPTRDEVEITEDDIAAAPVEIDTRDRESFQAAHALHFGGASPELALRAWDTYLSEFPEGRFVPEASWNRVICLLRLERREEARAVLERFARGAYGSVRREDAEQLLEATRF